MLFFGYAYLIFPLCFSSIRCPRETAAIGHTDKSALSVISWQDYPHMKALWLQLF